MFSAFLDNTVNTVRAGDEKLNKNYILLFPQASCVRNYFYYSGWHWYGFYKTETGIVRKKIEISFYNLVPKEINFESTNVVVSSSNNKSLLFILGSRNEFPIQNSIEPIYSGDRSNGISFHDFYSSNVSNDSILKQCNLQMNIINSDPNLYAAKITLKDHGTKQEIGSAEMRLDVLVSTLLWCGDLDGDNKMDYILRYGEKSSKTILYLSKAADKGQLVKPVAVFYSGYCC
ncbi:MAG: hypothetical protein IPM36_22980 [Lewinellaceae bacterium]|nr:hypothetical protein [Lewinellaceae bacterium]